MKKILFIFIGLTLGVIGYAKPTDARNSYNMLRAQEEIGLGNTSQAMDFLKKEIEENPKNGYAYLSLALIQKEGEEFNSAMGSVNKAIKLLPKNDKEFRSRALEARGKLFATVGDTVQALGDLGESIKINPENMDAYESRAQIYYMQKRYEEGDKDYETLIKLNPASVTGYMGLGRNANARGEYEKAVKQYDKVIGLYEDYASGYSFRAESYLKLGNYLKAADDIMKALSIDNDPKAHFYLFEFPADQTMLLATKLRGMASKNPHEAEWPYFLAQLYADKGMNKEAIEALDMAYDIDAYPPFLVMKAECLRELGEYAKAYEILGQAEQLMPEDGYITALKADVMGESGDVDGAIREWSRFIENDPDDYSGYYRRGFFEDNYGKTDEALEDYNMVVMLNPDYAYGWLGKGDMHVRRGETELALDAYSKVVALDTVPSNQSCAMYALLALGRTDDAVGFMERVIENDADNAGNYYDGACFYSRLGDLDKAYDMLRTSFLKGFKRFHHVMMDDDLEALRETERFKKLMEEFDNSAEQEIKMEKADDEVSENSGDLSRVEIPYTPDGGCFSVKCTINELPLSFIFDTGASTVSISQLEANFMLKNGYLQPGDFIGTGRFIDANGDVSEGSIINLRGVEFGGLKLSNVRASVVRNQKAPLLLGQSVLGRLGSIEIDNAGKKIIIKH